MPDLGHVAWVLDLDGVVWRGDRAIAGSARAVAALRSAGHRVGFCTNNSSATVTATAAKLASMDVPADRSDIVTSATAAVALIEPGEEVLVCGGAGVMEAVIRRGGVAIAVDPPGPHATSTIDDAERFDAVMVGFTSSFDYAAMARATRAVDRGARLLATNDDPRYPTATGFSPGAGAILASIERASGVRVTVAGKPSELMATVLRSEFGADGVFVGDSLGTDAAMAAVLGWPFGLVLTGNTDADAVPPDLPDEWVGADLDALVQRRLAVATA